LNGLRATVMPPNWTLSANVRQRNDLMQRSRLIFMAGVYVLMSVFMFPGTNRLPRRRGLVKIYSPEQALETADRTDGCHALIRGLVTA